MQEMDEPERRVQAALRVDPRTAAIADQLEVCRRTDGVEVLGSVDDVSARCRADRVARQAAAGVPVFNRIELVPYPPRQDGQIADHVSHALLDDPCLHGQRIQVTVSDGRVRLEGTADSHITQRLVTATCWWIPGVREVDNRMVVEHPEADRDWIVLEAIPVVFSKDWLLSGSNIHVGCRNGRVHLTGTVPGPEVSRAAENDVWVLEGVEDVINDLQVIPHPSRLIA